MTCGQDSNTVSLVHKLQRLAGGIDMRFGLVLKKVRFLGEWKVSLVTTISIVLAVIGARYYYSFVTGYIVPDEAWYYNTFILSKAPILSYRPAFLAIFLFFFHGVNNVWTFLLRGAIYSAIWSVGCVALFFIIFRRLGETENMSSLLILSLPLFPVFIVFVPTALTETPGLFMALVGVYFGLRCVQGRRMVESLLSVLFFFLAYEVREPYLLFLAGSIVLFLLLSLKRRSVGTLAVYVVLTILVIPVPLEFDPLRFAQLYEWIVKMVLEGRYMRPLISGFTVRMPVGRPYRDLMGAVVIALGYGFNPLFALFAVFSIFATTLDLFKQRSSKALFLLLTGFWSLGAFVIPTAVILQTIGGALSGWTSSIVRTTHASLPCIVGFPSLHRRLKIRRVAALIVIFVILLSTQVGAFATVFQRSLSVEPVDRLSLDYRAPYYRLYLLTKDSGKTLVFGGIHMREVRMYMAMLPNVDLVRVGRHGDPRAMNETKFKAWIQQGWDAIFLYDDWMTIPRVLKAYPEFYSEILRSREYPGYRVEEVWIDGESYTLKMVKVSDAN